MLNEITQEDTPCLNNTYTRTQGARAMGEGSMYPLPPYLGGDEANWRNSSPDADILKHVPTTCYTKIIVTSLILILSTARGGWHGQRGDRGGAAHKQPVSVAKYVDSTHNMKPEQEKEAASNVATVAWARALQKKYPRERVTARVGERERQKV